MSYDLLVIGSGSAAFAAGIEARRLDASVALVEQGVLGGTCVNIGCVPSKTLLAAAETRARAGRHPFAGLHTTAGPVDLAALIDQKNELVRHLRQTKYADVAATHGIELLAGHARFAGERCVIVDDRELTPDAILIATGAEPAVPDIPGLDGVEVLTSTTAMELRQLPERLVIIGAGFVGVEQAQLFAHLGSQVSLIGPLLPTADPELTALMESTFTDAGITRCGTKAIRVQHNTHGLTVYCADGSTAEGDRLLVATGRRARTVQLDLGQAGVEVDTAGHVKVDGAQRTTNPHVWAAGDVTNSPQFVYLAATSARIAAHNALTATTDTVDLTGLPHVVFTSPQLAWAGMTEAEARQSGLPVETRTLPLDQVPRALANRDTTGAIKLVAEAHTRRLLGVHVLADHGGEIMLAATIALKAGWTIDQLANTWAAYLTMNEGLKLAAQSFTTDIHQLSCCAS